MSVLHFQTDSHPDSLADARRRVRDAILHEGVGNDVVDGMEVAVGEALCNVHHHAYRGNVGRLSVEVAVTPAALTVVIKDHGNGISPASALPGPDAAGRGLYLAAHFVDDIAIQPNRGSSGTTITMTKHLRRRRPSRGCRG